MSIIENFNSLLYIYNKMINTNCKIEGYDDLSVNNYQYIIAIYDAKQITTTKLSEILGFKKASVTQMVQALIEKGYVRKSKNANDKRSSIIELTEKGVSLMKSEETIYDFFIERIKKVLTKEELNMFESLLDKVVEGVKN